MGGEGGNFVGFQMVVADSREVRRKLCRIPGRCGGLQGGGGERFLDGFKAGAADSSAGSREVWGKFRRTPGRYGRSLVGFQDGTADSTDDYRVV